MGRGGTVAGPVSLAPLSTWSVQELLCWADRAPFNGAWVDALRAAATPGPDGRMLTEGQRLRLIRGWDRLRQGVDAEFLASVGLLAPQSCPLDGPACPGGSRCTHDWSREELATALRLAPQTASAMLMDARELAGRSAALLTAVADGRLPAYAARRIANRLAMIADGSTVALVLNRVMSRVGTSTPGGLDRLAAITIESLRDPAEALAAHDRARRDQIGITPGLPLPDGMASATLNATSPEIAELLAWARTFTTANGTPEDTRTVGQRRIDALLDALTGTTGTSTDGTSTDGTPDTCSPETGSPGSGAGRRPAINLRLIMTADTLLGRTEDPAWLTGVGAIPAFLAHRLAITPTALQRALVDAKSGQLLHLGRDHRFAPTDLDRHVRARDLTCTWPGCNRSSLHAELGHITPWSAGGTTDPTNLHPLCPRHHRARDAGWTPVRTSDGSTDWTSPHGLKYQTLRPDPPGREPLPRRQCQCQCHCQNPREHDPPAPKVRPKIDPLRSRQPYPPELPPPPKEPPF